MFICSCKHLGQRIEVSSLLGRTRVRRGLVSLGNLHLRACRVNEPLPSSKKVPALSGGAILLTWTHLTNRGARSLPRKYAYLYLRRWASAAPRVADARFRWLTRFVSHLWPPSFSLLPVSLFPSLVPPLQPTPLTATCFCFTLPRHQFNMTIPPTAPIHTHLTGFGFFLIIWKMYTHTHARQ